MLQELQSKISKTLKDLKNKDKWYWIPVIVALQLLLVVCVYITFRFFVVREESKPIPTLNTTENENTLNTLHENQTAIQTNVVSAENALTAAAADTAQAVAAARNDTSWDSLDAKNGEGR